ncbi:MAG: nitrogen fixation protein NifX [Thioploca sp.]|nr:nitrogen fixation protein NifX [Thioploca sp.]
MTIKIAFASHDRQQVNQHFGVAETLVFYEVAANHVQLVEVVEFTTARMDGNEDKLATKIALLEGCAAVYCQAIGGSAIQQLLAHHIQPIKVENNKPIKELLEELQYHLRSDNPPAWLSKYFKRQALTDRFATMAAEGWQE